MKRSTIKNPVLTGFHPDPSITRRGDDYYIATSTFQWWPAVRIHHSRDLASWRHYSYAVTRRDQLDMSCVPDSGGVWAPCLSYDESSGLFHLIYSNITSRPSFHDVANYLITAEDPAGPWSDPIYLNGSGFDPSLFHDADGRKWFVNMKWSHHPDRNPFAGIVLQEYDPVHKKLVGPIKNIFRGTSRELTEAPHLYHRDGWYYLVTAEGGTSYEHAITVARSRLITGPYEVDPNGPLICTEDHPDQYLQKTGHGSFVKTPDDHWYVAFLCGRPLRPSMRCTLGRETAIEKVVWTPDGWPRLDNGSQVARDSFVSSLRVDNTPQPEETAEMIRFQPGPLHSSLNTLRGPEDESLVSTTKRPGWLRLYGGDSPQSLCRQSFVARRVEDFKCQVTTHIEFDPDDDQQLAGLIAYYDRQLFHYCHITRDVELGRCINVLSSDKGSLSLSLSEPLQLSDQDDCYLRLVIREDRLRFRYSLDRTKWSSIGPWLDASILSDDYAHLLGFTGMYVGVCAQDLSGRNAHADFEYLEYATAKSADASFPSKHDLQVKQTKFT